MKEPYIAGLLVLALMFACGVFQVFTGPANFTGGVAFMITSSVLAAALGVALWREVKFAQK